MDILDMPAPMDIPSLTNVVKDVAPPVSPLNIGQYDIVKGMTEADKAFPAPISDPYNIGKMGEFDSSPLIGSIQDPSELGTPSFIEAMNLVPDAGQKINPLEPFGGAGQYPESILYGDRFDPADVQKDFFKTSTSPDRPENISQIAENIAAQSGQQGFGIGQFLP